MFWKYAANLQKKHPCENVILIKLQSNFIEITFRLGCSPVSLVHIFGTPFPKNTSGRLLLIVETWKKWLRPGVLASFLFLPSVPTRCQGKNKNLHSFGIKKIYSVQLSMSYSQHLYTELERKVWKLIYLPLLYFCPCYVISFDFWTIKIVFSSS